MTTICGLGMMYFADFGKYRNSGPAIAISLVVALLACITLAPALVRAGGDKVFWPGGIRSRQTGSVRQTGSAEEPELSLTRKPSIWDGFWDWASRVIIAYPGWILVASVLVLLPPAWEGTSVPVTYDLLNELQTDRPSVVGTRMALRHYSAGEMTPLTILAVEEAGHFDEPDGQKHIAQLTKTLYQVKGVASVRSITEPLGDRPGFFQPFSAEGLRKLAALKHAKTRATYLTQVPELVGKVARFDVVLKYEPFSPQAIKVLDDIDQRLIKLGADGDSSWHNARFEFVGPTVGVRDLEQVTESDQRLIQRLTVLAVLGVLIVILRRPVVCVYLIVSVLLSYYVTIGTTEWVFSHLYAGSFQGLDWKVPIFLFVILIAVGEDYNIYLVTRVNEEQRAPRPAGGPAAGDRLDRGHHHQLRCDHGRYVCVDAQRHVAGNARARFRPLAGGDARYLHRPPDIGSRLSGRVGPPSGPALGRQGGPASVASHGPALDGRASVVCSRDAWASLAEPAHRIERFPRACFCFRPSAGSRARHSRCRKCAFGSASTSALS